MDVWKVKILYYGKIQISKLALSPGFDVGLIIDVPYLGFLLQNGKRNILVDTGPSKQVLTDGRGWGGFPADVGEKSLEIALMNSSLKPGDIDTILFTHLHYSHAGNLEAFANAQLIFQRDEWTALLDPLSLVDLGKDYDPGLIEILKPMNCLKVDGDLDLTDGIRIIKTPGHTPGSQSIVIRTQKGNKVIVGDHWPLYFMAFPRQEFLDMYGNRHRITPSPKTFGGFMPTNLICDYHDYYASCQKIKALMEVGSSESLIPGHEASLLIEEA